MLSKNSTSILPTVRFSYDIRILISVIILSHITFDNKPSSSMFDVVLQES